jgi:hypothetical protein
VDTIKERCDGDGKLEGPWSGQEGRKKEHIHT